MPDYNQKVYPNGTPYYSYVVTCEHGHENEIHGEYHGNGNIVVSEVQDVCSVCDAYDVHTPIDLPLAEAKIEDLLWQDINNGFVMQPVHEWKIEVTRFLDDAVLTCTHPGCGFRRSGEDATFLLDDAIDHVANQGMVVNQDRKVYRLA